MKKSISLALVAQASLVGAGYSVAIAFPGVTYSEDFDAALGMEWTMTGNNNNGNFPGAGWGQTTIPTGGVAGLTQTGGGEAQVRPSSGGFDDTAFGGATFPLAPLTPASDYSTETGGAISGGWLGQLGVGNASESTPGSGVFDVTNDGIARLDFNALPAHTSISLDVLIAAGGSWDGGMNNQNFDGPFDILVDGVSVFNHFFGNGGSSLDGTAGVSTFFTNGNVNGHYREQWQDNGGAGPANDTDRFNIGWTMDSAYDLGGLASLTDIPHTSSTLTVEFIHRLNSGPADEQIAVDALTITVNVPEPATGLLAGLAGMLVMMRRRR